jgi:hypothetical protein
MAVTMATEPTEAGGEKVDAVLHGETVSFGGSSRRFAWSVLAVMWVVTVGIYALSPFDFGRRDLLVVSVWVTLTSLATANRDVRAVDVDRDSVHFTTLFGSFACHWADIEAVGVGQGESRGTVTQTARRPRTLLLSGEWVDDCVHVLEGCLPQLGRPGTSADQPKRRRNVWLRPRLVDYIAFRIFALAAPAIVLWILHHHYR